MTEYELKKEERRLLKKLYNDLEDIDTERNRCREDKYRRFQLDIKYLRSSMHNKTSTAMGYAIKEYIYQYQNQLLTPGGDRV